MGSIPNQQRKQKKYFFYLGVISGPPKCPVMEKIGIFGGLEFPVNIKNMYFNFLC